MIRCVGSGTRYSPLIRGCLFRFLARETRNPQSRNPLPETPQGFIAPVQLLHYCMVITIDTSALLAVLLNEPHKPAIIEVTKGHQLQAPSSLDAEIGNALSALFKRSRLSPDQARQVLSQFYTIPIRRSKLRLSEAAELAFQYNIYAYDAYVLDCAIQYRTPLLSLDHQMKTIAKKINISILEDIK